MSRPKPTPNDIEIAIYNTAKALSVIAESHALPIRVEVVSTEPTPEPAKPEPKYRTPDIKRDWGEEIEARDNAQQKWVVTNLFGYEPLEDNPWLTGGGECYRFARILDTDPEPVAGDGIDYGDGYRGVMWPDDEGKHAQFSDNLIAWTGDIRKIVKAVNGRWFDSNGIPWFYARVPVKGGGE